jgi:hypothetical protein
VQHVLVLSPKKEFAGNNIKNMFKICQKCTEICLREIFYLTSYTLTQQLCWSDETKNMLGKFYLGTFLNRIIKRKSATFIEVY